MPLPLLLLPIIAAGGVGLYKSANAGLRLNEASGIADRARSRYGSATHRLNRQRRTAQLELTALGELKARMFDSHIRHTVEVLRRLKDARGCLTGFNTTLDVDALQRFELESVAALKTVTGLLKGAGAGAATAFATYGAVGMYATASTGTAISTLGGAAATNATLAWLGGGSLAAGGAGVAGGTLVLGGLMAAPLLLVGGFVLDSHAEKKLTAARRYAADIDIACRRAEQAGLAVEGIRESASQLASVISRLAEAFERVRVDHTANRRDIERMMTVAFALQKALGQPVINPDGLAVKGIRAKYSGDIKV